MEDLKIFLLQYIDISGVSVHLLKDIYYVNILFLVQFL